MSKITQEFGLDSLGYTQHNVEFVDLYLGVDNRLFIDYNKILNGNSVLYRAMRNDIESFMRYLFNALAAERTDNLRTLLTGLHESDSTHLGMSENAPNGNSVGKELKRNILANLLYLRRAFLNGVLQIDGLYFGIENIGPDRISDIITSVIKGRLIEFTKQQCVLYDIVTESTPMTRIYDATNSTWNTGFVDLPHFDGKPIIFVPKDIVSTYSGISGTLHSFIRYGFNNFFKTSPDYKALVRGQGGDLNPDLKRKEFDEYNKNLGMNTKTLSQMMITTLENRFLAEAFLDVRSNVLVLSNEELIDIIETPYREAN